MSFTDQPILITGATGFLGGALTLISAASFYFLHLTLGKQERFIPQEESAQPLPSATD